MTPPIFPAIFIRRQTMCTVSAHDPVVVDVTNNDIICGGNVVVSDLQT
jgi:hypothetical protein